LKAFQVNFKGHLVIQSIPKIALSGVEQCDNKQRGQENLCLLSHCSTPESAIQKWKTLFLSKIAEVA